jgi:hypothetical protein
MPLAETASVQSENDQLQESNKRKNASQPDHPPIGRRLVVSFFGVFGGFFLSLWGWRLFDYQRRYCGTILILVGWGRGFAGFGLLWVSNFRWTWSWVILFCQCRGWNQ